MTRAAWLATARLLLGLGLGGLALAAAGDQAGEPPALHLGAETQVDDSLAGAWRRAADDTLIVIERGDSLGDLAPGLYHHQDRRIFLRHGQSAGDRAASLVGLRTIIREEYDRRIELARDLRAVDHLTLVIASWRLADDRDWPWVERDARLTGLPYLSRRINPTVAGFVYDPESGAYRTDAGEPVRIVTASAESAAGGLWLRPGDLVTSVADGAEYPSIGILAADRGQRGLLDPEDLLVTAQIAGADGALAPQVHLDLLGRLHGRLPVHGFRRDWDRAQDYRERRPGAPYKPDNPIWGLPRWRQLLALAGLAIVTLVLLRNARRYKRRQQR